MNQTDLIASLFEDITFGLKITFVMVRSCFKCRHTHTGGWKWGKQNTSFYFNKLEKHKKKTGELEKN